MEKLLTPEELLAQAVHNDAAALAELYERMAPGILGLLVRMLPSRADAEEVLQEVFVRLGDQARSLEESGGSVSAWLVMVARALALRRLRRQRSPAGGKTKPSRAGKTRVTHTRASNPQHAGQDSGEPFLADSFAWLPSAQAIGRMDERRDLLRKVLQQLPKTQEEALDLALFGGYTDVEIAERLGEPLGKVTSSLQAAMTFLRHRLHAVLGTWTANV